MAKITTWTTETTKSETGRFASESAITTTSTRTRVTSIQASSMDVSVLRDLLRALDQANAPDLARVTNSNTQITVEWEHDQCVPGADHG